MSFDLLSFFRERWRDVVPPLTDTMLEISKIFAESYPRPLRPYEVYLKLPHPLSTVYKAVRSLHRRRLILCSSDGCVATVKAPIALIYHGDLSALGHVKKIWGLGDVGDENLIAYLILLGSAIKKLGFNLTEAFICRAEGVLGFITSFMREGGFSSLSKALDVPFDILKRAYHVHVKISEPFMISINGVKIFVKRGVFSTYVIAAKCPSHPVCGHELPEDCPLIKEALRKV